MYHWDYWEKGPQTWTNEYPASTGKRQSPIDIPSNGAKEVILKELEIKKYDQKRIKQTVKNVGYSWNLCLKGKSSDLQLWGGPLKAQYTLDHLNCHWGDSNELGNGSEHAVDGKKYEAEIHFLYVNNKYCLLSKALDHDDGVCMLAVFLKVGSKEHPEIAKLMEGLKQCKFRGEEFVLKKKVDILKLIPHNSHYFTYHGSLSHPPCKECAVWIVFKDPIEISQPQLEALNELKNHSRNEQGVKICNNYRPLCPIGSRETLLVKVPKKSCEC